MQPRCVDLVGRTALHWMAVVHPIVPTQARQRGRAYWPERSSAVATRSAINTNTHSTLSALATSALRDSSPHGMQIGDASSVSAVHDGGVLDNHNSECIAQSSVVHCACAVQSSARVQSSPVQSSPVQSSPVQSSPVHCACAVQSTVQCSPVQCACALARSRAETRLVSVASIGVRHSVPQPQPQQRKRRGYAYSRLACSH